MPSGDLTDVTLVSEDHEGPDDHNDSDDPFYHDGCDEDEDEDDEDDEQGSTNWRDSSEHDFIQNYFL